MSSGYLSYNQVYTALIGRLDTDVTDVPRRNAVDLESDRPADNTAGNEGYCVVRWEGSSVQERESGPEGRERVDSTFVVDVVRFIPPKNQTAGMQGLATKCENVIRSLCDPDWYTDRTLYSNGGGIMDVAMDSIDVEVVAGGEALIASISLTVKHTQRHK